jgi:hypothetical protein
MSELQAELCLKEDIETLKSRATEEGWLIEGPKGVVVDVRLTAFDDEVYWLRFTCSGYPEQPFSIKPIDHDTKRSDDVSAWPQCEGFRPTSDLCMPLCAEGYALHPVWQKDPRLRWQPEGNALLRVLEELQLRLSDQSKYRGRMPKG